MLEFSLTVLPAPSHYRKTIAKNNPKKLNLTPTIWLGATPIGQTSNTQHNHRKAKSNQQTTVRSDHTCLHCTAHNTAHNRPGNFPCYPPIIIAPMMFI